jgi:ribosome maturation factor RimP
MCGGEKNLQKEHLLDKFIGKYCKVVIGTNEKKFIIEGVIDAVSDDFFILRSKTKSSMINICEIREITPL